MAKLIKFCLSLLVILNLRGSDGQAVFNRTFLQPAMITSPTGSSSVCVGSSVVINCTIEVFITTVGFIITGAIWSRDGANITDSTPGHTVLRTQPGLSPVVTGLMVDNATLDDNGTVYTCTSDAAPDDFTSSVVLNVTGGPPSPVTISNSIDDICTTTISGVSWSSSTGDPVCGPVSSSVTLSSSDEVVMMNITDTSYNFTGLTPGTDYTVSVAGMNMAGVGQSDMMMFRVPTVPEAVPSAVTNLGNTTYRPNMITVTWDAASSPYCGGVLYYEVMISSNEDSNIPNNIVNVTDLSMLTATLTATFSDLMNATSYNIGVVAGNRAGTGTASTVLVMTSSQEESDSDSDSSNAGPIAGGVVGGVAVIGIAGGSVVVLIICFKKKSKVSEDKTDTHHLEEKSPTLPPQTAADQSEYAYARTGPISVNIGQTTVRPGEDRRK